MVTLSRHTYGLNVRQSTMEGACGEASALVAAPSAGVTRASRDAYSIVSKGRRYHVKRRRRQERPTKTEFLLMT